MASLWLIPWLLACRASDPASPASPPVDTASPTPHATGASTGGTGRVVPPTADSGLPVDTAASAHTGATPLRLRVHRVSEDVHLAWRARYDAASGPVQVHLSGPDGTDRTWVDDDGDMLLLGLHADTEYELSLTPSGEGAQPTTQSFTTLPLPEPFPILEVLGHDPARVSPGHLLVPASHPTHGLLIILDEDLEPVWVSVAERPWYAAELIDERIVGIHRGNIHWVTLDGEQQSMGHGRLLHHDVVPWDVGYLALGEGLVDVDDYPTSITSPTELGPATLLDQHLVTFDAKGKQVAELAMTDVLPVDRCAWEGQKVENGGKDWLHLNSLAPTGDGRLVLSARTQSTLIAVDPAGTISWMLGDPMGWSDTVAHHLLTPVGDLTWPEDQHAPHYDPVTGDLFLFDNGGRRFTPYEAPPAESGEYSRLVHYRIDETAGTVEERWSWQPDPPVFAPIMGDADPQPDGHVLSVFTWLLETGGVAHEELGWGRKASRIIEVVPGEEDAVLDLRLRSDDDLPDGWWTYRVQRIPRIQDVAW